MITTINYSTNWPHMEIRKGVIILNQNWELISQGIQSLNLYEEVLWPQHVLWAFLQKILIHLVFYFMGLSPCVNLSTQKWHKNRQYTSLILIFKNMFSSILYEIKKMLHEYKEWNIFPKFVPKKTWVGSCLSSLKQEV
jgi:hypothetical protein